MTTEPQLKLHAVVLDLEIGGKFVLQSISAKSQISDGKESAPTNSIIKILIGENVFVPLSTHSQDMKLFSEVQEAITVASHISRTEGIRKWPLYKHVYAITLSQM